MNESAIQSKILKYLRATYKDAYIVKISDRWISGIPDILMVNQKTYFFEVKTKFGKTTRLQNFTLGRLTKAGAIASVVRSINDVKEVIING